MESGIKTSLKKTVTLDKLLVSLNSTQISYSYREIIIHFSSMISAPNLVGLTLRILFIFGLSYHCLLYSENTCTLMFSLYL